MPAAGLEMHGNGKQQTPEKRTDHSITEVHGVKPVSPVGVGWW